MCPPCTTLWTNVSEIVTEKNTVQLKLSIIQDEEQCSVTLVLQLSWIIDDWDICKISVVSRYSCDSVCIVVIQCDWQTGFIYRWKEIHELLANKFIWYENIFIQKKKKQPVFSNLEISKIYFSIKLPKSDVTFRLVTVQVSATKIYSWIKVLLMLVLRLDMCYTWM